MTDLIDDLLGGTETPIQQNVNIPTLIIDTSYAVYYTMFSVWTSFQEKYSDLCPKDKDPDFDPAEHPEFIDMFRTRFFQTTTTAAMKLNPFISEDNMIFVKDCPKRKIWRIEYYPDYKLDRINVKKDEKPFSFTGTFNFVNNSLLPEFEENGAKIIGVPTCEGDDIIATLARNQISKKIIILASDRDILQLVNDDVTMIDIKGKVITFANELDLPEEVVEDMTGSQYIIIKAMMGDRSDGIANIHARCGKKTAIKYFFDKDLLQAKMNTDANIANILKNNLHIMDFKNIPSELTEAIMEQYVEATEG